MPHVGRAALHHTNTLVLYSEISPRREVPSRRATPASSISRNTLILPREICLKEHLLEEKADYETLIQEGGQPSHPVGLKMKAVKKHEKYKDITRYWISQHCGLSPFSTQLDHWGLFREWQDHMRELYKSHNRLSDYPRDVNERRRRHNLEGNADIRLDRTQQSGLDDWMEYQDRQLGRRENLEEQFRKARENLDAAKKETQEAGDSRFGDEFEESRSDPPEAYNSPEDSDSYEESDVPSQPHEPDQWRGQGHKLLQALRATASAERQLEAAELDSSKEIS